MLNRFLELDKDFKKGNLTLTDGRNIFTYMVTTNNQVNLVQVCSLNIEQIYKKTGGEV